MERRSVLARGVVAALASQLLLVACGGGGGDDGGVTNPPPPPPAAVASVTVTLASSTINVTQTSQATAVLRDAQNNVLSGRTVTWSSSNTSVATVSATSGLVTGVAAGTANVIATSESRAGKAQVTVTAPAAPPQISGITVTQNGQAANLAQVVGALTVSFNVDVPAGYSGTLIVSVDTAEFYRQPISAPAFSATGDGAVVAAPITVTQQVIIETSRTSIVVSTDQITELPSIRNGARIATLTVQPNLPGGLSATQTFGFTAANPMHAHGLGSFDGATAIGTDTKTYTGGAGVGAVLFAIYGNEVINEFEVTLTDVAPQYGHGSGGVITSYQTITRTDQKKFPIPAALVEKPNLTYILNRVKVDGININPQVDYFGNAQVTTDLIGSGFANTLQQVTGVTPPAGKTFQLVTQPAIDLMSGNVRTRFTIEPLNLDNLGPRQLSTATGPVFSLVDRETTVGADAFKDPYGFGAFNGQISAGYDFTGGYHPEWLTDISGLDPSRITYYVAPISDRANLYTQQYRLTTPFTLPESNGMRTFMAGARLYDKRGNASDFKLSTSLGNIWNIAGNQSTGTRIGVDDAAFGFTRIKANLNLTAMPLESTWNNQTIDPSLCWLWNVSGSQVGLPNGWLSMRAKKDGQFGLGAGVAYDKYQIIPSTGGPSSGTATYFTAPSISQIFSKVGGTSNQGLYEFEFMGADNAGQFIADDLWPRKYRFLYDYTAPTNAQLTYNGTVTAGVPASGTLSATDNVGLKQGMLGMRFSYTSNLFAGSQVYVPIGEIPIPAQNGTPVKSLSMPIMGTAPIGFWFFDPFSGVIDQSNFYRSNGASWQVMDYARNLSPISFVPFSNSAPIPTITNVSSVKASMSSTNWCPGTCAGGGQNIIDLIFNYLDPLSAGPPGLSKAEWFAIPSSGGGIVYRLGAASTLTSAVEGTGRRLSYNLQLDVKTYCGPPGPAQVFVVGYNPGYYLKVNPFFSVNIQTPARYSNDCMKLTY